MLGDTEIFGQEDLSAPQPASSMANFTFFHTESKIAVDNCLLVLLLLLAVLTSDPEVLWVRLSSALVGRFRISFVVREKWFPLFEYSNFPWLDDDSLGRFYLVQL